MLRTEISDSAIEARDNVSPEGFTILIAMPEPVDKIGNVYITQDQAHRENVASITGLVLSIGPDAYQDENRFPNGPRCKVGDHVMFRSYSGTRFKTGNREFRIINDDTVDAVVKDPQKVERAV